MTAADSEILEGHRPGRLWSLWDIMNRFRASSFAAAIGKLHQISTALTMAPDEEGFDAQGFDFGSGSRTPRAFVLDSLKELKPILDDLSLSRVLRYQFERLLKLAEKDPAPVLAALIPEYSNNLLTELSANWFLAIPADQRELYEQRTAPFGDAVEARFPKAAKDIRAAARCFALNEWTACVFHLMRTLEHGLRWLAVEVGLGADAMAHENWKNVIDLIEAKIRAMEGLPKSPEKIARLKELSRLASQFRYFKDAWRNHVSHAHESYDDREAENVWHHVKTFMEQMAAIPSASP